MRAIAFTVLMLGCSALLAGCQGSVGNSSKSNGADQPAKPSMLGRWTTSTSPEMASNRTTMAFLESGEFQFSSPLILFGKLVTAKVEGKEVAARLIASGIWELEGDRIHVRITQSNQSSFKFDEPWEYQVISNTDKKLVLKRQKEDGNLLALFREE